MHSNNPQISSNHYIFIGKVMHKRFFPKKHFFVYNIYYFFLDFFHIQKIKNFFLCSMNRFNLYSFYDKDHGYREKNKSSLLWLQNIIKDNNLENIIDINKTKLLTMPRVLGYVFNPVSFWLLHDANYKLIATLYEVNNTFGYTHTYLAKKHNNTEITKNDVLIANKVFHVSPFFTVEGYYKLKINIKDYNINLFIDYYKDNALMLKTSLCGYLLEMSNKRLWLCFIKHPLITIRAILLIHYHAILLYIKKINFYGTKFINKNTNKTISVTKEENSNAK